MISTSRFFSPIVAWRRLLGLFYCSQAAGEVDFPAHECTIGGMDRRIHLAIAAGLALLSVTAAPAQRQTQPYPLEKAENKTILVFTPHPDDDTFCCAGTLSLLARQHNNIHIVLYTNDDKGSYDAEMNSQRLAQIRSAEEEEACRIIGIPKENIHWFQF